MVWKFLIFLDYESSLNAGMSEKPIEIERKADSGDTLLAGFQDIEKPFSLINTLGHFLKEIALGAKEGKRRDAFFLGRHAKVLAEFLNDLEVQPSLLLPPWKRHVLELLDWFVFLGASSR